MAASGSGGGGGAAIRAGRAFVSLGVKDEGLKAGLNNAKKLVDGFAKSMAVIGAGMFGLGSAILAPIAAAFRGAVEHFDSVKKAADRLGTSAEIISALGYAAKQSGTDMETLETAAKAMQRHLVNTPEALLDNIMGKSGRALMPLLKDGAAGIRELMEEAKKVGSVVSGTDAANAEKVGGAISRAWTAVKNTFLAVGAAILPQVDTIERLTAVVVDTVKTVRDWISENREVVLTVVAIASAIAAAGATLMGIATVIVAAKVAFAALVGVGMFVVGMIKALIAAAPVIAIIVAVAAAVGALVYVLYEFTKVGDYVRSLIGEIGTLFTWLKGVAETAWQGIAAAISTGDFRGALDVVVATLEVLWAKLKLGAQQAWNWVKGIFVDGWYDVSAGAEKAFVDIKMHLQLFGADIKGNLISVFKSIWEAWKDQVKTAIGVTIGLMMYAAKTQLAIWQAMWDAAKNPKKLAESLKTVAIMGSPALIAAEAAGQEVQHGHDIAEGLGKEDAAALIRTRAEHLKLEIDRVTAAKKAAAAEFRGAELAERLAELQQKEDALRNLVNEQLEKKAEFEQQKRDEEVWKSFAEFARQMTMPIKAPMKNLSEFSGSRGAFVGKGIGAELGVAGASIEDKQLDALEEIKKNTGKMAGKFGNLLAD
jgi:hypothetical protein